MWIFSQWKHDIVQWRNNSGPHCPHRAAPISPCKHSSLNPISASATTRAACQRPGEQWGGRGEALSALPHALSPPFPFLPPPSSLCSCGIWWFGIRCYISVGQIHLGDIDSLEGRSGVPQHHYLLEGFAKLFELCGLVLPSGLMPPFLVSFWFCADSFE